MRIAFVTDNHFYFRHGFDETVRIHDFIAEDAARRGCRATVVGGDLFETKSCAEDRNAAAAWLIRQAEIGPVIGVYGNHEYPGDLDLFNQLKARHPILFHARPTLELLPGLCVACVPWPRKAHLLAQLGSVGSEEAAAAAAQCLRTVFEGLAAQMDEHPGAGRLALAHVMIDGATTDHDQPLVGTDMSVSLADLALLRAHFLACGHIHAQQDFLIEDVPCVYGGAPRHNNFGEPGPKGYVVIDFDGPRLVGWERVATPTTPMVLMRANWTGEGLAAAEADVTGAVVRVRVAVPADQRDGARRAAEDLKAQLLARGAGSVKIEEEVQVQARARVPELARAATLEEKLDQLWASKGFTPGERREPLLAKVQQLEAEVDALQAA